MRIGVAAVLIAAMAAGSGPPAQRGHAGETLRVPEDYRTIQAAIDAAPPGGVIDIAPGRYRETLVVRRPVTLRGRRFDAAHERNNTTILDGGGGSVVTIPPGLLRGTTLVGLVVANGHDGIAASSPFTVKHSYFTGNEDGIDYSRGAGGLCVDNLFVGQGDDALDFDHPVRDARIVGNRIFDTSDDGIEIRLHDDVIARTAELAIRGNEIAGSAEDGIQLIDYADDTNRLIVARRNLLRDNAMAGIGMMPNGDTNENYSAASVREQVEVFNNTFLRNHVGISGGDAVVAVNNIFQRHAVALKGVNGRSLAGYNLFAYDGVVAASSNADLSTSVLRPALLDANARLRAGSPAIDAGTARFKWAGHLVLDLEPSAYRGPRPDLGWYERR
jgi:nitrous oxidase accessory protein NosD